MKTKSSSTRGFNSLFLMPVFLFWLGISNLSGETVNVTILHVNDSHGCGTNLENDGDCSMSRAAAIINDIREEEGPDGNVFLLHGGDAFFEDHCGNTISDNNGPAEVIAMNYMGFDAMVMGNHEFDERLGSISPLKDMNGFTMLSANVFLEDTDIPYATPYTFREAGGVRIAIFGLSQTAGTWNVHYGGAKISTSPPEDVAETLVPELRDSADLVIGLFHIDDDLDRELAKQDIDLIVGSHDHTQLDNGDYRSGTMIAQADWHYNFVGRVDIVMESNDAGGYDVSSIKASLISTDGVEPDSGMSALLLDLEQRIGDGENLSDWKAPDVEITSPSNGQNFLPFANVTVNVDASDAGGSIDKVELRSNGTLVGTDNAIPYSFDLTSLMTGRYTLQARAYDNEGAVSHDAVSITVNDPSNQPPTVSITSPSDGDDFTSPADVTISVNADKNDGSIDKVELRSNGTLVDTDSTMPYSFNFTSLAAGSYTLEARAYDNVGAVSTASINITVTYDIGQVAFAVNCSGNSFTSTEGIIYDADKNFTGGGVFTTTSSISGTADAPLYQSERYGNTFSYAIPLENGTYQVILKFAELYHNGAGLREFNVALEGEQVISGLDIWSQVGKNAAHDETHKVTLADGELNIDFSTITNNAKISAILVLGPEVPVAIADSPGSVNGGAALSPNLSGRGALKLSLPERGKVDIWLFNVEGRQIHLINNLKMAKGWYTIETVDVKLRSGIWFYKIQTDYGAYNGHLLFLKKE